MSFIQVRSLAVPIPISADSLEVFYVTLHRAAENQPLAQWNHIYIAEAKRETDLGGKVISGINLREYFPSSACPSLDNIFYNHLMGAGIIQNFSLPQSRAEEMRDITPVNELLRRERNLSSLVWNASSEAIFNAIMEGERRRLESTVEESSIQFKPHERIYTLNDGSTQLYFVVLYMSSLDCTLRAQVNYTSGKVMSSYVSGTDERVSTVRLSMGDYEQGEVVSYLQNHGVLASDLNIGKKIITAEDRDRRNRALPPVLSSVIWKADGGSIIDAVYRGNIDRLVVDIKSSIQNVGETRKDSDASPEQLADRFNYLQIMMNAANYFPLNEAEIGAAIGRIRGRGGWWDKT